MPSMSPRDVLLEAALVLAAYRWEVFPLYGKKPAIRSAHPEGDPLRGKCHGEICGRDGHGMYDASSDFATITRRWRTYPMANVGARVPENGFVFDVDPRNGGAESLAALMLAHGPLPDTMMTISGRYDAGSHRFFRRPPGKLTAAKLGPGIDLKTHAGYTLHAPSIHPDTGKPYVLVDLPIAEPPDWLVELITPPPPPPKPISVFWTQVWPGGDSIADSFSDSASWADVLEPHGWTCTSSDPDSDGAVWLHPHHTSDCSATVRHGCLFVYSTNTPFEITEPSNPMGYTRFRAYAVLNHDGDLSSAASALRKAI